MQIIAFIHFGLIYYKYIYICKNEGNINNSAAEFQTLRSFPVNLIEFYGIIHLLIYFSSEETVTTIKKIVCNNELFYLWSSSNDVDPMKGEVTKCNFLIKIGHRRRLYCIR